MTDKWVSGDHKNTFQDENFSDKVAQWTLHVEKDNSFIQFQEIKE